MNRRQRQTFLVTVAMLFAAQSIACVGKELRTMDSARAEYDACVVRLGSEHPDCEELRQHLIDTQQRYEDASRRAWNCNPHSEHCPVQR